MFFVALVFGELASNYPVAGALYQYSKFSVGPRYGWFVGWFYGLALLITVAAVDNSIVLGEDQDAPWVPGRRGLARLAIEQLPVLKPEDTSILARDLTVGDERWSKGRRLSADDLHILATADHDLNRLACGSRTAQELRPAFAFLLTWGSVPSIYYGDEIGMRYLPGMPDVEGAVCNAAYNRAGCRTPMQWDDGMNAGFSTADASALYLPIDPDPDRPTVAAQLADPSSLLHLVRSLIALRRDHPALGGRSSTQVLHAGYPFAYVRAGSHLVVVNPRRQAASVEVPGFADAMMLLGEGVRVDGSTVTVDGFGFGVWASGATG